MANWRDEYIASLKEVDEADPVITALVIACSTLQDQAAALQAENGLLKSLPAKAFEGERPGTPSSPVAETQSAQLRVDLAEALRSQGKLQLRLKMAEEELEFLRLSVRNDGIAIRSLTSERNALIIKVRDRDEELRGKSKLVENVQDELIALNLQLNISEQQRDKTRAENKQLVDRWMQRMGQEAEAMNTASEPFFANGPKKNGK